jgi:hypothetical protein
LEASDGLSLEYSKSGWRQLLDEVDALGKKQIGALESAMSKSEGVVFIVTTNNPHLLEGPFRDRCHVILWNTCSACRATAWAGKAVEFQRMGASCCLCWFLAPACHAGGRGFESRPLRQNSGTGQLLSAVAPLVFLALQIGVAWPPRRCVASPAPARSQTMT